MSSLDSSNSQSAGKASLLLLGTIAGKQNMELSKEFSKAPLKRMKFIHSLISTEIQSLSDNASGNDINLGLNLKKLKKKAKCIESLYYLTKGTISNTQPSI